MRSITASFLLAVALSTATAQDLAKPSITGTMVDLGGHRLHFNCTGRGRPTIVIENGFEEFSFDWIGVQSVLSKTHRVCTYDRAGYAWSDPGPKPRTFAQINLELHDSLKQLREPSPYLFIGHAFGAPIVRNYAITYPGDVFGIVFVDGVSEDQRFEMWHKSILMRDGAKGKIVPSPREEMTTDDKVEVATYYRPNAATAVAPPFDRLPQDIQLLHLWAQSQRSLAAAEENEREWSPEYFAKWHNTPNQARLGTIPLIVLTREQGGFHDLDLTAAQQELERRKTQNAFVGLSSHSLQKMILSGEITEVENPDAIIRAVQMLSDDFKPSH